MGDACRSVHSGFRDGGPMKRRALKVATYGKTGREYYRLHERAAAQRRAVWTITVLVVFIVAVVIMREVAR